MNVHGSGPTPFQHYPYLKGTRVGAALWWRGGDIVSPDLANGTRRPGREADPRNNYFNTIPAAVRHAKIEKECLPFLTIRIGRFGVYAGWKAYGFDSDAYKDWPGINPAEVHEGSVALTGFTLRATTKLGTEG